MTQNKPLPYGRHLIEDDDVAAVRRVLDAGFAPQDLLDQADVDQVLRVLRHELLAQGPEVEAFEKALALAVGAPFSAACSSGTAALHLALASLGVGEGDLCVVPTVTFLATATAVRFCGAEVVFADVDPITGLMTAETLAEAIGRAGGPVKVALAVHLAGRMCDMAGLAEVAAAHGILLVEDACHALGSVDASGYRAGSSGLSEATVFSFHPVKTIACGEGGMVASRRQDLIDRVKRLRNHGVTRDASLMLDPELSLDGAGRPYPWSYEQLELGFNYRMSEIEAALGRCQLAKLDRFVGRRQHLCRLYDEALAPLAAWVRPVAEPGRRLSSPHLYTVHLRLETLRLSKAELMRDLLKSGIGTQVHYIPVHRQPYFRSRYGPMQLSGAEAYYRSTLSLPLYPGMMDEDALRVTFELAGAIAH